MGSIVIHFGDRIHIFFSIYFKTISSFPTICRKENISEFPERTKTKTEFAFKNYKMKHLSINVVGAERRSNFKQLRHFVIKTTNGQTFGNDSGSLMSFQAIAHNLFFLLWLSSSNILTQFELQRNIKHFDVHYF